MRALTLISFGCLLAIGLVAAMVATQSCLAAADLAPESKVQANAARQGHKLPKLFDFQQFKKLFSKKYSSLVEELSRKRYFFARAFRAFVTGTMYKFKRLSYYEAVNPMSDWSDEEREQTLNHKMAEEQRKKERLAGRERVVEVKPAGEADKERGPEFEMPEFIADEHEDVEAEVVELIEANANAPGFAEMKRELEHEEGGKVRRKREAEAPREFDFNKLLAGSNPKDLEEDPNMRAKIVRHVESNNRDYEPIELATQWSPNDIEEVQWLRVHKKDSRSLMEQAKDYFIFLGWMGNSKEIDLKGRGTRPGVAVDSEMFLDLRQSGCMAPVRSQGRCGSCYAFASITIMEYLFCKKTGQMVEFSEQYMVDCGSGRAKGNLLSGCRGAFRESVVMFLHNFGLQTRREYPYQARVGQCPLNEDIELKRTGYIRMPLNAVAKIPMNLWAEALQHGPLYVGVAAGKDFSSYGGGVYNGKGCRWFENHAMVLVGHGREDGLEFWLMRNSHSAVWGERGYFKIAKKFARRCTTTGEALSFGTSNGFEHDVEPQMANPNSPPLPQAVRSLVPEERRGRESMYKRW